MDKSIYAAGERHTAIAEALPLRVVVTCKAFQHNRSDVETPLLGAAIALRAPRPAHKATTALLPAQCCSANDASCGNDQPLYWRFTNRAERSGNPRLYAIDAKL